MNLNNCENDTFGDLVDWTPSRWSLRDGASSTSNNSQAQALCQQSFSEEVILIPDTLTFYEANFTCNFLSGSLRMILTTI